MKPKLITTLAVVTALAVGGLGVGLTMRAQNAQAAEASYALGNDENPFGFLKQLKKLDLSDKQKTDVRAVIMKNLAANEPLIHKMVDAKRAVRDAIQAPTIDEKKIRDSVNALAAVGADAAVARAHTRADVLALLTDSQKQILMGVQKEFDGRVDRFLEKLSEKVKEAK